jgi:hypothetical protein
MTTCTWKLEDYEEGVWQTECGNAHVFEDGDPTDNQYKFCPYCGKALIEAPEEEEEEE